MTNGQTGMHCRLTVDGRWPRTFSVPTTHAISPLTLAFAASMVRLSSLKRPSVSSQAAHLVPAGRHGFAERMNDGDTAVVHPQRLNAPSLPRPRTPDLGRPNVHGG